MEILLRYGSGEISVALPEHNPVPDVFSPREAEALPDLEAGVRTSLAHPLGCSPVNRLVRPGQDVSVVVDDVTRAVPTRRLLPPLLEALTAAGVRTEDVSVIVATGLHRPLEGGELDGLLGPLAGTLAVRNHDPHSDLRPLGRTSLGTSVRLNRGFLESDFKVLIGDVEFHQFCGFGGGAKSVFPGLADAESIRLSHSRMGLPGTGPGRLDGNPVRAEIDEIGRMAGVGFIVNVVLNSRREVVEVLSGDLQEAFLAGARTCRRMYSLGLEGCYDVVLASAGGYPKDIDLYQSQKAIAGALQFVKPGGRVVLFAECREGHGSETAYQWVREASRPAEIVKRLEEHFVMGGHKAYQLAKAAERADIYLCSVLPARMVTEFFMRPLTDPAEVTQLLRKGDRVAVLPEAALTVAGPAG